MPRKPIGWNGKALNEMLEESEKLIEEKKCYYGIENLSQKEEVFQLISDEVNRSNQKLPELARVASFCLLSKELDPEDDELTQTQKLRRSAILSKYGSQVQSLYPGEKISAGS